MRLWSASFHSYALISKSICIVMLALPLTPLHALAATAVFTPLMKEPGSPGIYIQLDYHPIDGTELVDFQEEKPRSDWKSVLSNYYYSVQHRDRRSFLDLYTQRDGGREAADKMVDSRIPPNLELTVSSVQNLGMFRVGRLILPLVEAKFEPPYAESIPIILCYENACYATGDQFEPGFFEFYRYFRGRHEDHARQVSTDELAQFEQKKLSLPYYRLGSSNPEHQAQGDSANIPTVFLDLQSYPDRRSLQLDAGEDPEALGSIAPEVATVLGLLRRINSLDKDLSDYKSKLGEIFEASFDDPMVSQFRLPMFRLENGTYENFAQKIDRYALTARHWQAITPVGYLDQGVIRYVFFYPQTSFHPLDANGEGIVQVLPTIKIDGEYKLGFNGLLFSYRSALQLPPAISLYMNYFDRNSPTTPTIKPLAPVLDVYPIPSPGQNTGLATSAKLLIAALVLVAVLGFFAILWLRKKAHQ